MSSSSRNEQQQRDREPMSASAAIEANARKQVAMSDERHEINAREQRRQCSSSHEKKL
jgi:hypothetical protein